MRNTPGRCHGCQTGTDPTQEMIMETIGYTNGTEVCQLCWAALDA